MTDLLSLYVLAEDNGIEVDGFDLEKYESLSIQDSDGDCFIAIDPFKLTSQADEKVKLAHEIGHCVTGSFYNKYATCDLRQRHENRANKWAIRKIIPENELYDALKHGHREVWDLAEIFGVTEDFMRMAICWYQNGNLAVDTYYQLEE